MGYDYHIGVDYHKTYSHIVVQDTAGKTLRSGRVRNDSRAVAGFLSRYSDNAHAVMEATRNWTVMFDWLDEIRDEVKLAHPLKVKAGPDAWSPEGTICPHRRQCGRRRTEPKEICA